MIQQKQLRPRTLVPYGRSLFVNLGEFICESWNVWHTSYPKDLLRNLSVKKYDILLCYLVSLSYSRTVYSGTIISTATWYLVLGTVPGIVKYWYWCMYGEYLLRMDKRGIFYFCINV